MPVGVDRLPSIPRPVPLTDTAHEEADRRRPRRRLRSRTRRSTMLLPPSRTGRASYSLIRPPGPMVSGRSPVPDGTLMCRGGQARDVHRHPSRAASATCSPSTVLPSPSSRASTRSERDDPEVPGLKVSIDNVLTRGLAAVLMSSLKLNGCGRNAGLRTDRRRSARS